MEVDFSKRQVFRCFRYRFRFFSKKQWMCSLLRLIILYESGRCPDYQYYIYIYILHVYDLGLSEEMLIMTAIVCEL